MKKFLLSTTVALMTVAGVASAEAADQSVLERVLGAVNGTATPSNMSQLNGVFANIAESYTGAIDGGITNAMTGIDGSTASVGSNVLALSQVTVDIGNLATTVLGSVNTGTTTLGVNQKVDEAIAGSSSAVSNAISQIGGSADSAALVLNISSNVSDVTGSVSNTFSALNGSIGNVATTVLGAVNTGTITSGVGTTVEGVTSGIVGN